MEKYMGEKVMIGEYVVDTIAMLDNATCVLYFEDFKEGDLLVTIITMRCLDEDSWHFMDNYYDEDGKFIDAQDTTHLTDEDKQKCKDFINGWLEDLDR